LTQKEFAAQMGIGMSTLQAWLRKANHDGGSGGSAFLAVPNLLSSSPTPPSYRIQWPDGLSLELRSGFADQELAVLLEALRGV
jgi:transcriptional regulator with XRE-family HTH domain